MPNDHSLFIPEWLLAVFAVSCNRHHPSGIEISFKALLFYLPHSIEEIPKYLLVLNLFEIHTRLINARQHVLVIFRVEEVHEIVVTDQFLRLFQGKVLVLFKFPSSLRNILIN